MVRILTIDFETDDPYIARKLGAGWVYGINVESSDFAVLGAAVRTHEGDVYYETDMQKVRDLVRSHDVLIMHNATYDLGCLHYIGADCRDKHLFDTEVMSRLFKSSLPRHNLDAVAKKYLGYGKKNMSLVNAVVKYDLYPYSKKEAAAKLKFGEGYVRDEVPINKLEIFCKKNMRVIQELDPEAMAEYACADVIPTYELFQYFRSNGIDMRLAKRYSMISHILVDYRRRGVRVDIEEATRAVSKLEPIIQNLLQEIYSIAGCEFNLNSSHEKGKALQRLGLKVPRKECTAKEVTAKTKAIDKCKPLADGSWKQPTDKDKYEKYTEELSKGKLSVTKDWLEKQPDPICLKLLRAGRLIKLNKDFLLKIINMQEYSCPESIDKYGRIFPELNLMGARTGRFTSSCPNIQQIPSRDPEAAAICRAIFVPEEGEEWYCCDFSNQEGRLMAHYAYLLKCEGASELKVAFDRDPHLDVHSLIASILLDDGTTYEQFVAKKKEEPYASIRDKSKAVFLGICYGMGVAMLGASIGLNLAQTKLFLDKFYAAAPYVQELNAKMKQAMLSKGYVRTLGGRRVHMEDPMIVGGERRTFEYKALNAQAQGSAADQAIEAMIWAYREGIPVLFPIHDELVMSGTLDQAKRLSYIMENAVKLEVPVVAELGAGGDSWATGGH